MRVEFVEKAAGDIPKARIRRALESAARHFKLPTNSEVSVCSVSGSVIRRMNATYRGKSSAADVLSFPQFDEGNVVEAIQRAARAAPVVLIGDIMINEKKLTHDAPQYGRQPNDHIEAMIVHSFLHLLGYDHERPLERRRMERLEHILHP